MFSLSMSIPFSSSISTGKSGLIAIVSSINAFVELFFMMSFVPLAPKARSIASMIILLPEPVSRLICLNLY